MNDVDKLECIKSLWQNETLIPALSDKTIDRSSESFNKFIKCLPYDVEYVKCMRFNISSFREDRFRCYVYDQDDGRREGIFQSPKIKVDAAEILQTKFSFRCTKH